MSVPPVCLVPLQWPVPPPVRAVPRAPRPVNEPVNTTPHAPTLYFLTANYVATK